MRPNFLKTGLAAIVVTASIGSVFAAPVNNIAQREALYMRGVPPIEVPGTNPASAMRDPNVPIRHSAQHNVLRHEIWLNKS